MNIGDELTIWIYLYKQIQASLSKKIKALTGGVKHVNDRTLISQQEHPWVHGLADYTSL